LSDFNVALIFYTVFREY